ncbi:phage tail protein [Leifsonia sp. Root227]|uniref:siderophore-interacting protein n=1 Tax=Leifsonia sp. Root227 TaxID=1736496 RepID=UPI0006F95757|nr:siderophore-interacting protein [Leifsonia sp. Root227]KRC51958.1 phage tail protein [Leifsonia sp. Root227]
MARTNAERVKPEVSELIILHVLRSERISPTFIRITLGGGDIAKFRSLGFDQWFRFFIPTTDELALTRLPAKLDTFAYARYLTMSKSSRPVLRNYTVSAFRPEAQELDVDFVLHGSADDGTSGPAATWAQTCATGDAVALLDEGIMFAPAPGIFAVRLVADETGLPAVGGILASLDERIKGTAIVEVPHPGDVRDLPTRSGVELVWVVRDDPHAVPGAAAALRARDLGVGGVRTYGWVVGESSMAVSLRRHWVGTGLAKGDVTFCGYWKRAH